MNLRWKTAQFFEVIWWRFYLRRKNKEEYLQEKKLYWHKLLQQCGAAITIKKTDNIIDMGCGPSGVYIIFPDHKITAVDPLLDKYEKSLPIFSKADYPNVKFVCSSIEDFSTPETFDFVFCMNAINHVKDIQKGYNTLAALGAEHGKIVVTIDAHNNSLMKAIFRIGPGDILHPHQYDLKEYINFLEQSGYKVTKSICLDKAWIFNHYILVAERKQGLS